MKTWKEMALDLSGKDILQTVKYSVITGIVAHGTILFSKISWRNDLDHAFTLNQTKALSLGRWFKAALCTLVAKAFGGKNLSLPLFLGVVSLLLIALTSHVIIHLFDIRRKSLKITLCTMLISFPVVTSTFGYMYAAPYYFFALLLAALAVYIAVNRPRWDGVLASVLCVSCCLGIYQAYFPVAVSLFVIALIFEIARNKYETLPKAILRGVYYLGVLIVSMAVYFAIWKVVLMATGIEPNDHQGVSSIGQSGLSAYLQGIVKAYRKYLPVKNDLYPMGIAWAQWIVLALSVVAGLCLFFRHFREHKLQALMMLVLMAMLPLCLNLVYVMVASSSSDDSYVYTLMQYAQCMLYVFLICSVELIEDTGVRLAVAGRRVAVGALALLICMDIYFDNACYMKAEFVQEQTISNLTVMIAKIKSVEGYTDKTPVCFVSDGKKDETMSKNKFFKELNIAPYNWIFPYHKYHYFVNALKHWCGFEPKRIDQKHFKNREEVKAMTTYPDDGSIKMIDDTIVVKW